MAQLVQVAATAPAYVPALHGAPAVAAPPLYWPVAQLLQAALPVDGWYWPAGHSRQALAPVEGWAAATSQGVHLALPLLPANWPAAHLAGAAAPAAQELPAAQTVQSRAPELAP